jgi:hypothetical protein|tara:strand:- start:4365 stop:5474 length:1110 start_codon:yes stop_codon:yes gene_type:complete
MATLGPNALLQYALPTNWDAATLSQTALQSGETYEGLLKDITAGLAAKNASLLQNPLLMSLVGLTTEQTLEYGIGVSNGFQVATEFTRPDSGRGATVGHMLPLDSFDRGFGWTWMFLRKARRISIDNDIAMGMNDLQNKFEYLILNRLFLSTAVTIGSGGKSVPIADGGTADSAYVPPHVPERETTTFTSSHTHLLRLDGITQANLNTAVKTVWEHNHDGPYDLLIAAADLSDWTNTTNVTGYVARSQDLISYGSQTATAVGIDPGVIGVVETDYGTCRLRATARIPTAYWSVYKSYGLQDQRNVLALRYSEAMGIGAVLLAGDHIREFPMENAIMFMEMGVGVGDRTAAAIVENDSSGDYASPTIVEN